MQYPPYPISNRLRRTILSLFIVIFLITAPALTLYTAGYKFDWQQFRLTKSGVLSVDIEPHDAQVSLNGIVLLHGLPLRLPNLSPGTYHLSIAKEGFHTWTKDIVIEESKTTYIRDLHLFTKQDIKLIPSHTVPVAMYPSPNGTYILEKNESNTNIQYDVFETQKRIKTSILKENTPGSIFPLWSPEGEYVAMIESGTSTTRVYLLRGTEPTDTNTYFIPSTIENFQWSDGFSGPHLLAFSTSTTYQVSRNGLQRDPHVPVSSTAFFHDDKDTDWYFENTTKSLVNLQNKDESVYLGKSDVLKVIDMNSDRVLIEVSDGIAVVPRDTNKEMKLLNSKNYFYIHDTQEFLIWSPWEIWNVQKNGDIQLLNRMSEEIREVIPLDKNGTLFLVTPTKLLAFNPRYYFFTSLIENINIEKISNDMEERKIYLLATKENTRGLYELEY